MTLAHPAVQLVGGRGFSVVGGEAMSWPAVASFVKELASSPWMKNQAPHVVVLFVILGMATAYFHVVQPRERQENREAWKQLRADIQDGHERIEVQHTTQVDRISTEFKSAREQDFQLIQLLLNGKVAGAKEKLREISRSFAEASTEAASEEETP